MIFNVNQILALSEVYSELIEASNIFSSCMKKTIMEYMKTNEIISFDISDCFLSHPIEIFESITANMNIISIVYKDNDLFIQYDGNVFENFDNLTPTDLITIYIVHFQDGINKIKNIFKAD